MVLHSQIIGKGTPFVILHGFLGMSDNWKTLGNQFAEAGYQVHLLDQRNHGHSFHSDEFSYELMAEDLKEYCIHHDIKNMVLLGHSMGGKTAMTFAVTYPQMVSKLIVADIGPKAYPLHHQDILKALSTLDFDVIKTRGEAEKALAAYIADPGTRLFLLKNLYWEEKGKLNLRMNLPILSEKIEEVGKALNIQADFTGKTLFLRGEKSGYIDNLDKLLIHKQFPEADLKTVSNAGHWLHAENPIEFYQYVMEFL